MPWLGAWHPGQGPRLLVTRTRQGKTIMLGPTICYESLSPRHAASLSRLGADLLVTLSNDAWLGEHGAKLHLVVAAFRSVETRLPQVRASNSGISALVLANGDLVAPTEFGVAATRVFDVPNPPRFRTLATRWGDWLGALAGYSLLGLIPWALARRGSWFRASRSSPHSPGSR
jgi:apolipoprotein N-acyltransferase